MQKRPVEPVAVLEVTVAPRLSVAPVSQDGMPDGGQVPPQLMLAPWLRPELEQAVAADNRAAPIARDGGPRRAAVEPLPHALARSTVAGA